MIFASYRGVEGALFAREISSGMGISTSQTQTKIYIHEQLNE